MDDPNHVTRLRAHLMSQLEALRSAKPDELPTEIQRAKAVSDVAQVVVNTAKVQVDYINAIRGAGSARFLEDEEQPDEGHPPISQQSPLPTLASTDPARLGGPSSNHPWRRTTHRMKR